ncbi:MAG: zinc ribbon domain-containing protein [Akkermansia sp.]|nr:zinc ribbon domain-containing protein [Akkermansia sp.]
MYCHQCGSKLSDDAVYCAQCGTRKAHCNTTEHTHQTVHKTEDSKSTAIIPKQTINFGRFGSITLDTNNQIFHLELYKEKISGIIFKSRERGKCVINRDFSFAQLLDYKTQNFRETKRSCVEFEQRFGIKEGAIFDLNIEIMLNDCKDNYIRHSFGIYASMFNYPTKEYEEAVVLLGKFTSALEIIKQHR